MISLLFCLSFLAIIIVLISLVEIFSPTDTISQGIAILTAIFGILILLVTYRVYVIVKGVLSLL